MKQNKTKTLILIALCAALTAVGAFIRVPLPIVPFTMQFFFCALSGIVLGAKHGAIAQAVYVCAGLAGAPIFSKGYGGLAYVLEPTFGYLLGFIATAAVIGLICKKHHFWRCLCASLAGIAVLYTIGTFGMWLNLWLASGKVLTFWQAIMAGAIPFLGGDIVSAIILALIAPKLIRILGQASSDKTAERHN